MPTDDEVIARMRGFLSKQQIELKDQYFLFKKAQEDVWDEISSEEEETEEESFDDFSTEESEEPEEEEEKPRPTPAPKPPIKKGLVRKPPIAVKKPQKKAKEEDDFDMDSMDF